MQLLSFLVLDRAACSTRVVERINADFALGRDGPALANSGEPHGVSDGRTSQ